MKDLVNGQPLAQAGYRAIAHVQAGRGSSQMKIGRPKVCRFCGERSRSHFRTVAHTIPEGLGNRWITSLDECDDCNGLFATYDSALCQSVGAILTLGGISGKNGKVRQTGRSSGNSIVSFDRDKGTSNIFFGFRFENGDRNFDPQPQITFSDDGTISTVLPAPPESFVPRLAYKALSKVGLSIIPEDLMPKFGQLNAWIRSSDDSLDFPFLDVAVSTGSLEKAPPIVAATVLERLPDRADLARYVLSLTAGSVNFQTELMWDADGHDVGVVAFGSLNIPWAIQASNPNITPKFVAYSKTVHLDWSSRLGFVDKG